MSNIFFKNYTDRLTSALHDTDLSNVAKLANDILTCWNNGNQVFFCGNGGSAGNASHLANDFIYGVAKSKGKGIRAISLNANVSVLTCLANDVGYDNIFSEQLAVLANPNDVLIALSGSGNSSNIVSAINEAKTMSVKSYAILGFDGGKCIQIADHSIHLKVNDMQLSEDFQIIVGHMLMQWLFKSKI
jgi:D-sedoheptulose 7-phosphate isomerase